MSGDKKQLVLEASSSGVGIEGGISGVNKVFLANSGQKMKCFGEKAECLGENGHFSG